MSNIVTIEEPREWDGLLSSFFDANIYQSWGYGEARATEAKPVRLVLEGDRGKPLGLVQLRLKTVPGLHAGLAYCYFGPIVRSDLGGGSFPSAEETLFRYKEALRVLLEDWVHPRGLLLRIVPHLPEDLYPGVGVTLQNLGFQHSEARPYQTILVDLQPGLEEIKRSFRPRFRTKINKAEKQGIKVEVGEGASYFERFDQLYNEMYARKGFHTNVCVSTFSRAQTFLQGKDRMRVFLATLEGKDIGGLVLSAMGDTGIYLLGATRILEDHPNLNGSNLLHWKAMEECKERGLQTYDLCGIDPEKDPGGYRFKTGFRGRELIYPGTWEWGGNLLSKVAVRAGEFVKRLRGR